jgi:adenosine kinase
MPILVSGSLALDHIMVFPDRFKDHILPDKLHILNVAFNIKSLDTHFGGVAGNIAYHLRQLGEDPLILASVGNDFGPYADWLDRNGIDRRGIRVIDDVRTAQGFVTTDLDDNQIWAFYEGAMARAHEARVDDLNETPDLAIVSSDGKQAMVDHARAPSWTGTSCASSSRGRPATS